MTIVRPKKKVEDFISGAPDSEKRADKPKYVKKGKKVQITLTIAQPLLEKVDELAGRLSLSRAAVINLAIHQGMEHGINVDGKRAEG